MLILNKDHLDNYQGSFLKDNYLVVWGTIKDEMENVKIPKVIMVDLRSLKNYSTTIKLQQVITDCYLNLNLSTLRISSKVAPYNYYFIRNEVERVGNNFATESTQIVKAQFLNSHTIFQRIRLATWHRCYLTNLSGKQHSQSLLDHILDFACWEGNIFYIAKTNGSDCLYRWNRNIKKSKPENLSTWIKFTYGDNLEFNSANQMLLTRASNQSIKYYLDMTGRIGIDLNTNIFLRGIAQIEGKLIQAFSSGVIQVKERMLKCYPNEIWDIHLTEDQMTLVIVAKGIIYFVDLEELL